VYETQADEDGNWSITADSLDDGTYTPLITVTDAAGNQSDVIEGTPFTVDTVVDTFTGGLTHDETNDTGASATDGITNNSQPTLSGVAEAGATVVVDINNQKYETQADDTGAWQVALDQVLPDGDYTPSITVTDLAGNTSTQDGETFTVDTVADLPVVDMGPHQVVALGDAVDIDPFAAYPDHEPAQGDLVQDYSGGLPDGLSIDAVTGHIVGTATATGATFIEVSASDLAGNVASSYFQLVVTASEKTSSASAITINSTDSSNSHTYIGDSDAGQHLNIYSSVGDVVLAGGGNDLFQLFKPESLSFSRLDGGAGLDTVKFSSTGETLDFADWNNPDGAGQVVEHVEVFQFASNASLTVSAADLFHLQSDALDVDGKHELVIFKGTPTNGGSVSLDGLTQVGAVDAFGSTGGASSGASSDKYTKFTGTYTDAAGDHLVELLLQHGLTAA
jgi:hypothetical protein